MKILAVALVAMASSCSKALLFEDSAVGGGAYRLIISGRVSEANTLGSLEGIKITFSAYSHNDSESLPVNVHTVYTDSNGIYWITVSGFSSGISCVLKVEDPQNKHEDLTTTLAVDWSGPSFIDGTFYINDMNLTMKRR